MKVSTLQQILSYRYVQLTAGKNVHVNQLRFPKAFTMGRLEHQNRTLYHQKVVWFDETCFLLNILQGKYTSLSRRSDGTKIYKGKTKDAQKHFNSLSNVLLRNSVNIWTVIHYVILISASMKLRCILSWQRSFTMVEQ